MCVNSHNKNRMTHPLRVAKNCKNPPFAKGSKTDDPATLCSGPPPLYFLTSPLIEGNGYETRQSSLLYVIVLFYGLDPAQNTIVYNWLRN